MPRGAAAVNPSVRAIGCQVGSLATAGAFFGSKVTFSESRNFFPRAANSGSASSWMPSFVTSSEKTRKPARTVRPADRPPKKFFTTHRVAGWTPTLSSVPVGVWACGMSVR